MRVLCNMAIKYSLECSTIMNFHTSSESHNLGIIINKYNKQKRRKGKTHLETVSMHLCQLLFQYELHLPNCYSPKGIDYLFIMYILASHIRRKGVILSKSLGYQLIAHPQHSTQVHLQVRGHMREGKLQYAPVSALFWLSFQALILFEKEQ